MNGGTGPVATADRLRVGDAERDAVAAELREHYALGRITLDELTERLDRTFAARTAGELRALTADLPARREPAQGAGWPPAGGPGPRRWPPHAGRHGPPVPFVLVLLGFWVAVIAAGAWWLLLLPLVFGFAFRHQRYLHRRGRRYYGYRHPGHRHHSGWPPGRW